MPLKHFNAIASALALSIVTATGLPAAAQTPTPADNATDANGPYTALIFRGLGSASTGYSQGDLPNVNACFNSMMSAHMNLPVAYTTTMDCHDRNGMTAATGTCERKDESRGGNLCKGTTQNFPKLPSIKID